MIPWNKGLTKETDPRVKAYGEKISGKKNHNWKGGRKMHPCGYVLVLRPDHPRANHRGYVMEHFLIWERYRGPIPPGYIIHHKNDVKDDNRIENLEAILNEEHAKSQGKGLASSYEMSEKWRENLRDALRRYYRTLKKYPFLKPGESMKGRYIVVSRPDHPRSDKFGRVPKHILVWEEANGRSVPPGWDVHHIDENKFNNDPSNLIAEPHEIHARRNREKLPEKRKIKISEGMKRYWVRRRQELSAA